MDAIDALAHHALRAPQRIDTLRSSLRSAPTSTAHDENSRASVGPSESTGSGLSRDGVVVAISKSPESAGAAFTCLRKSTGRHLAHGDSSYHLDSIRGCGLPKLPAGFRSRLVVSSGFGGILILAV
jgi:hypothetical protein